MARIASARSPVRIRVHSCARMEELPRVVFLNESRLTFAQGIPSAAFQCLVQHLVVDLLPLRHPESTVAVLVHLDVDALSLIDGEP